MTPDLQALIGTGAPSSTLNEAAVAAGMRALRDVALERVRHGETTLAEVQRVVGEGDSGPTDAAGAPPEAVAAPADAAGNSVLTAPPPAPAPAPVPASPADTRTSSGPTGTTVRPAAADDQAEPRSPHVLVADDEPTNRVFARTLLEKAGYRVSEAVDGLDALGQLDSSAFDLLVLDLDMPKLAGNEVLTHARRQVATAGLPIVVFTSAVDASAEADVMEHGADDYIRKPIDARRFMARVKAALRRASG